MAKIHIVIENEHLCCKTKAHPKLRRRYEDTPEGKPTPNWMYFADQKHPQRWPIDIDREGMVVVYGKKLKKTIRALQRTKQDIYFDASGGYCIEQPTATHGAIPISATSPEAHKIPPMPNTMCPCDTDDG